ncbi:MAG: glycosyltransferase family 39 protein, partial [Acidobacteriota bacterium]
MDGRTKRAVSSGLLLLGGVAVAICETIWLANQNGFVPELWGVPVVIFTVAFFLAFAGGRLSAGDQSPHGPATARTLDLRHPAVRYLCAAVAAGGLLWILVLQEFSRPPVWALLIWIVAMAAAVGAFPGVSKASPGPAAPRRRGVSLAVAGVVLLAAAARLIRLDLVPPVISGDEAAVAMDGREVLLQERRPDPFGTGIHHSMHVGMLPAGAGTILFASKLAGPRFFPAVIGSLAVAATAGAAAILAGPWAALGAAALIAFSPHHVHFSRNCQNVICDSLIVTAGVLMLFATLCSGSPRQGALAGVFSGLALYGYGGGKVLPVVLAASLPLALWRFRGVTGRRAWLSAAMVAGFLVAAGPNLHFAAQNFREWNGRWERTSIFNPDLNRAEVERLGSAGKMFRNQLRLGTIGLLSAESAMDHFTGFPIVAPALLPSLGIAGLGWLYGRRRFVAEATIAALVVAGNLAGVSLTFRTPEPQRLSSLIPMLALLGGVALAGFLTLLPRRTRGAPLQSALGALLVGVFLARQVSGYPLDWIPYAQSGGRHAALMQSVSGLVGAPRYAREPVYFHGPPWVYWDFHTRTYLLPNRKAVDVCEEDPVSFAPGLHIASEEYLDKAKEWAESLGLTHGVLLPHPAFAMENVGYAFLVPAAPPSAAEAAP